MNDLNRRQFLKSTLASLVHAAGSVTLASAAIARAQSQQAQPEDDPAHAAEDLRQKADALAAGYEPVRNGVRREQPQVEPVQLRRRRRGRPVPWGNGGWSNGGWRNRPFLNGGWPNVGWSNFPWANGGWPNGGGWRNW